MGVGVAIGVGVELRLPGSCGAAMRGALAGLESARLGLKAAATGAFEGLGLGVLARGCFGNGTSLTEVLRGFSSGF